jgi:hypothetical protein
MIPVIPLSQRDPRWAAKLLGFPTKYIGSDGKERVYTTTIGQSGCTLTCMTMLLNYRLNANMGVDEVNEQFKRAGAFSGPLIYWSKVPLAYPVKFVSRYYNYNNFVAWKYTYIYHKPVVVQVNASKIGATQHWCLMLGDKKMADPWTGNIVSTSTYPLTGLAIYDWS